MVCLITPPRGARLGVITFTTPEFREISGRRELHDRLIRLREKYLVGLHHNWHPVRSNLDERFDFHMLPFDQFLGELPTRSKIIPIDACNFSPKVFTPVIQPRVWDVLIIGRAVKFKRPRLALEVVRKLLDERPNSRVLFVAPMPPLKLQDWRHVEYSLQSIYRKMFTSKEREKFTLLCTRENYPFPFNRDELSVFYNSSRLFVHFAGDETRCRVAAYAWASGVPVVGSAAIGSVLEPNLRKKPAFFEVSDDRYVEAILEALQTSPTPQEFECSSSVTSANSVARLIVALNEIDRLNGAVTLNDVYQENLDIRLGYHNIEGVGNNSGGLPMQEFIDALFLKDISWPDRDCEFVEQLIGSQWWLR